MKDLLEIHKLKLLAVLVLLIIIMIYFFIRSDVQDDITFEEASAPLINETSQKTSVTIEEPIIMMVDVKGAVRIPDVYVAEQDERVIDLIKKAGGFTDKADQNQVNLSQHVEDEMVIYVPNLGDSENIQIGSNLPQNNLVNINKASDSELQTLPGIGPSKALAIIEYRDTNGGFRTVDEIKKISGIGEKTFEKLEPHISIK
ncbi:ComE operon protein 1 [Pseudoneobacillus rhizosphaerae]|uniref:ComE operon protein 1 n=2 Tax=Pseudoneobacillus rhizosphaerae TaxID=2880968 RepID=A0A9C7G9L1_9BACI|nr:ComE operon protein 1 [Pseudoneobacillus rhizosphaerae]